MSAHRGVMEALKKFISGPDKSIVYIIGNHDAEFVFDSLKEHFFSFFGEDSFKISLSNSVTTHTPTKGVSIQNGHQ